MGKKKYTVSLDEEIMEKSQKYLSLAGLTVSAFLNGQLIGFVDIVEKESEKGFEIGKMTASEVFESLSNIYRSYEQFNKESQPEKGKKKLK